MNENRTLREAVRQSLKSLAEQLHAFLHAPPVIWGINLPYFLEGIAYFGTLTVLMKYLSENLALQDVRAGIVVSLFTGAVTFVMFFLGEVSDRLGIRRVLVMSIMLMCAGRVLLASSNLAGDGLLSGGFLLAAGGLAGVALGFGMLQPTLFAGVRKYADARYAGVAFAVLYGVNNLGAFLSGLLSPPVRHWGVAGFPPNGINAVLWVYVLLTFASIFTTLLLLRPSRLPAAAVDQPATGQAEPPARPAKVFSARWFAEHPMRNARFTFFIFVLIPVQTLFAHQWLTLPLYINRAFVPWVSERFELFSNLGPLLVFLLAPVIAAVTAKKDTFQMIQVGTLVMALPAFLLVLGPHPLTLFAYIVLMTVGESIWQPRFMQYIAEIAPPGKTGAYIGIGQFPWFLTKVVTGFYAGWFLKQYCPADGPKQTELLWLIYAIIAMVTPVALFAARRWLRRKD